MKSSDNLKLIQCYHCWQFCHIKSECPKKYDPKLCPRCGEAGHSSHECKNTTQCIHCEENHPATARICIVYKQKFAEVMRELTNDLSEFQNPEPITPPVTLSTPDFCKSQACDAIISAFNASHSPDGFLTSLYGILQTNTPKKIVTPLLLAYECELDRSDISNPQESLSENSEPSGLRPINLKLPKAEKIIIYEGKDEKLLIPTSPSKNSSVIVNQETSSESLTTDSPSMINVGKPIKTLLDRRTTEDLRKILEKQSYLLSTKNLSEQSNEYEKIAAIDLLTIYETFNAEPSGTKRKMINGLLEQCVDIDRNMQLNAHIIRVAKDVH